MLINDRRCQMDEGFLGSGPGSRELPLAQRFSSPCRCPTGRPWIKNGAAGKITGAKSCVWTAVLFSTRQTENTLFIINTESLQLGCCCRSCSQNSKLCRDYLKTEMTFSVLMNRSLRLCPNALPVYFFRASFVYFFWDWGLSQGSF